MQTDLSIEQLVPHQGEMCLLSRIVAYGDDWIRAEVDIDASSTFARQEGIPAWIGIEYMAQAVAAFSGIQQQSGQPPRIGFLLGTRRYICNTALFAFGQTLTIEAHREMQADNGLLVFQCVLRGEQVEAQANLNIFEPEDVQRYTQGQS